MIKISPKVTLPHRLGELSVGGGNDAHVHPSRRVLTQTLHLAFLQGTQQLGLHRERKLAHFIEEQGAPVSSLEAPDPRARGAGEGSLDVAKQLILGQRFRQRRTVDLYQRRSVTDRATVQTASKELLAHPITGIESTCLKCVQGQNSPGFTLHMQADPHAIMDLQRLTGLLFHQAIVRVRQTGIRWKKRGATAGEDSGQARMVGHFEAPP